MLIKLCNFNEIEIMYESSKFIKFNKNVVFPHQKKKKILILK